MYKVMWWNARGDACISEEMTEAAAIVFRDSMLAEQEARLVYINKQA